MAAFFFLSPLSPDAAAQTGGELVLPLDPAPLVISTGRGPKAYKIEIADDASERAVGMMFRQLTPLDRGMLFDFGETRLVTMWMRNTFVPLDILFIGEDMRVSKISSNAEPRSLDIIGSGGPVRFALELAAGSAERDGIGLGDKVQHPSMARALGKEIGK